MGDRPFTTRAQHALELADAHAAQLGNEYVGTEHLLIGLLEEKTGPAAQILNHLGVTTDSVRAAWQQLTGRPF
jgi:ATP-dependent Clp protease ATP-binding subunit ClpC